MTIIWQYQFCYRREMGPILGIDDFENFYFGIKNEE